MIKHHPSKSCRAVAAFAVAAVLSVTSLSAQTVDTNIFGGVNPGSDTLSVTSQALASTNNSGSFGPAYNGTLNIGQGAGTTLRETMNTGGNGQYTISEIGTLGLAGSFTSTKTFAGSSFAANQYYQFTLTRTAASAVSLFSSLNVQLSTTSNGVTTEVLDTSTGTGSAVSLLTAFGAGTTATFTFQTPANIPTTTPITVTFSGGVTANALGSAFTFTNGALQAVPEPGTWAAVAVGISGLAVARLRRRLA